MAGNLTRRAALATASAGAIAAGVGLRPARADATAPLPVTEVAPGIFVFHGAHEQMTPDNLGAIANVGFIVGDDAVAVIDTGGCARGGERLRAAIRAATDRPIRYVIASHVHLDHLFGHAAFVDDHPEWIGHAKLPAAMAMRGKFYLDNLEQDFGEVAAGTEIVEPTLLVEDRLELDLGGRTLELVAHPTAHTDNDLSVFDQTTGTLWLADLLFMERLPVIDGSLLGWLELMDTLTGLPAERVVPGHGPVSAPWPAAVADEVRYLTTVRDEIRTMIAEDRSIEEAMTAASIEGDRWLWFDFYHPRNLTNAYTELEWE